MKVADFFATLGFKIEDKGAAQFENRLNGFVGQFTKVAAIAGVAVVAIERFTASTLRGANELYNFNQQTGLSIEKLQQWQSVATQLNPLASTQDVMSSVQAIQNQLTQIKLGGGNIRPFQLLGIGIGGDAFDVLDQLRARIKNLSRPVAVNLLGELGISPEMIQALTTTNDKFEELSQNFVLSQKSTLALAKLNIQIAKFKKELTFMKDKLVADLVPALTALMDIVKRVGNVFGFFFGLLKKTYDLMAEFPKVSAVIVGAIGAIAIAIAPVTAAILGLMLLLEDFVVYMQGGKSLIGTGIEAMAQVFEGLGETISQVFSDIADSEAVKTISGLIESLSKLLPSVSVNPDSTRPEWHQNMLQGISAVPQSLQSPQNVFNNNFNIQTLASPDEIAQSFMRVQKKQMSEATQDFNRGADY